MLNPYNSRNLDPMDKFRPKRPGNSYLSTPQKKVLIYFAILLMFGWLIYPMFKQGNEESQIIRKSVQREDDGPKLQEVVKDSEPILKAPKPKARKPILKQQD